MTDTPDQDLIDAAKWLSSLASGSTIQSTHAKNLLTLIPDEVKKPTYGLPNLPGRYIDKNDDDSWVLRDDGVWRYNGSRTSARDVARYKPLRPVPVEKPDVDPKDLLDIIEKSSENGSTNQILAEDLAIFLNTGDRP